MRCPACSHEVGEASTCPACESPIPEPQSHRNGATKPRGQFRGRMDSRDASGRRGRVSLFQAALMLSRDPGASRLSKFVLWFAVVYIISPLDALPGGLIPVIGWIDDIIIGMLAWNHLKPDLQRYQKE